MQPTQRQWQGYMRLNIAKTSGVLKVKSLVRQVPQVAWQLFDCADNPTTVILDGAVNLAPNLIAKDGSIALRITQEAFSKELCYRFQKAIVSTSANISGEPAAQNYRRRFSTLWITCAGHDDRNTNRTNRRASFVSDKVVKWR